MEFLRRIYKVTMVSKAVRADRAVSAIKVIMVTTGFSLCSALDVSAGVVAIIPGFNATYPSGQIGGNSATGIPSAFVKIPPADEYYLDYEVSFDAGWEWVLGGKLPGLVGGSHTSGCADIVPNGWSARFMWRSGGLGQVYLYHQDRKSGCGDEFDFPGPGNYSMAKSNRITEHVIVNAPGKNNGLVEAWLDGVKKISLGNLRLRGSVAANLARVDQVSLQTFYGGSTLAWAPNQTTHSRFKGFVVRTDLPDFSKPFDANASGVRDPVRNGMAGATTDGDAAGNPVRTFTLLYTGNQAKPVLPPGTAGQRLSLFDLQGKLLGGAAWNKSALTWEEWTTRNLPEKSCVLIARITGATDIRSSLP